MTAIVEFRGVDARYPGRRSAVLTQVDIELDERPTLLLGRNGAGKSTFLKIGAGILRPKAGQVSRHGRVSYLPQRFAAVPGLSCQSYVGHLAWLAGQNWSKAHRDAPIWLERVGLNGLSDQPNTNLSGGQQSRLGLAMALNSGAKLVMLDEPGAALDPLSKADLLELYSLVTAEGAGLVVSSHDPSDFYGNFERVLLVDQGEFIFDGPMSAFGSSVHADPRVAAFSAAMRRGV